MAEATRNSGVVITTINGKRHYIQLDGRYSEEQIKTKLNAALAANEFVQVNGELVNASLIFRAKPVETV